MVFVGWINIYAAVYNEDIKNIFDTDFRSGKQFIWIILAFILAIVVLIIDYRFYAFFSYILYGFSILLLIAVLIFGKEINGAKSWFVFGGISFQPSELAKLTAALALSRLGSSHIFKINSIKSISYAIGIMVIPMLLILVQPDVGSVLVFVAFIFVLYREGFSGLFVFLGFYIVFLFVLSLVFSKSTVFIISILVSFSIHYYLEKRASQIIQGLLLLSGVTLLLYAINRWGIGGRFTNYKVIILSVTLTTIYFIQLSRLKKLSNVYIIIIFLFSSVLLNYSVDYVFDNYLEERHQKRINIVLGIEEDPLGVGYNVEQSKIAIGSGGFSGKGYLQGTQTKFKFVPEQTTDFIFCTVGEEWGFLGSFFVVVMFVILLLRILYLAERQKSTFSRMFGYSVFTVFFLHFAINLGMTIGLMPVIGIPLPFFSYGGSSLWSFTVFLFIFLRLDASRSVYLK